VYYSLDDTHISLLLQVGLTHHRQGGALPSLSDASSAPAGRTR
jgi:hypothetical protein